MPDRVVSSVTPWNSVLKQVIVIRLVKVFNALRKPKPETEIKTEKEKKEERNKQ
jgi:hypothetical protein